jgi:hypothetical protein
MVGYKCLNVFGPRIGRTEHVTWREPSRTTPVGFTRQHVGTVIFLIGGVLEISVWLGGW